MKRTLSLAATYHLRKLLHQNYDRLISIVVHGAGLKADPLSDLNTVLESLYLEDEELSDAITRLEQSSQLHQSLSQQASKHRQELRKLEQDIFWLLGFKIQTVQHRGTILAVDDTQTSLKLLTKILEPHGYEVHPETTGRAALATAQTLQPDLILLDVMLPDINGYELCDRLKQNLLTRSIPVIFVSTMSTALDKVKAFDVGGVDYLQKPIQPEEAIARLDHQINLRNLQKRLETQNIRLQQAESLYRDLFESAVKGIYQSTADGHYLRVNTALAKTYGYTSPEELLNAVNDIRHQIYVDPQKREEFTTLMESQDALLEFESQVYRKDGSIIWIAESARKVFDDRGNFLYYEGMIRDITDQKTLAAEFVKTVFHLMLKSN